MGGYYVFDKQDHVIVAIYDTCASLSQHVTLLRLENVKSLTQLSLKDIRVSMFATQCFKRPGDIRYSRIATDIYNFYEITALTEFCKLYSGGSRRLLAVTAILLYAFKFKRPLC